MINLKFSDCSMDSAKLTIIRIRSVISYTLAKQNENIEKIMPVKYVMYSETCNVGC